MSEIDRCRDTNGGRRRFGDATKTAEATAADTVAAGGTSGSGFERTLLLHHGGIFLFGGQAHFFFEGESIRWLRGRHEGRIGLGRGGWSERNGISWREWELGRRMTEKQGMTSEN